MSGGKIALYEYNRSGVESCQKTSICIKLSIHCSLHPCHIPTVTVQLRPPPRLSIAGSASRFLTYSHGIYKRKQRDKPAQGIYFELRVMNDNIIRRIL